MKTVRQAILDEIYYPINEGLVENKLLLRGLTGDEEFTTTSADSVAFKGALADCLYSLIQAVNFSEADKSVSAMTDEQRRSLLRYINKLYTAIGEEEVALGANPRVYINC